MFKHVFEYIRVGDWRAALDEARNTLWLAIWWNYRCVQAWEIHIPAGDGLPKRVMEITPDDTEDILYAVHNYLRPGCRAKIYIRYVSGRRKRVCLR